MRRTRGDKTHAGVRILYHGPQESEAVANVQTCRGARNRLEDRRIARRVHLRVWICRHRSPNELPVARNWVCRANYRASASIIKVRCQPAGSGRCHRANIFAWTQGLFESGFSCRQGRRVPKARAACSWGFSPSPPVSTALSPQQVGVFDSTFRCRGGTGARRQLTCHALTTLQC